MTSLAPASPLVLASWDDAAAHLPGLARLFTGPHHAHFVEPDPSGNGAVRLVGLRSNVAVGVFTDLADAARRLEVDTWWVEYDDELVPYDLASAAAPAAGGGQWVTVVPDVALELPNGRELESLRRSVHELRRDLRWHVTRLARIGRSPGAAGILSWLDGRREDDPVLARTDRELQLAGLLALRTGTTELEDCDALTLWIPAGRVAVRVDPLRTLCTVLLDGVPVAQRGISALPGDVAGLRVEEARIVTDAVRPRLQLLVHGPALRWTPGIALDRRSTVIA